MTKKSKSTKITGPTILTIVRMFLAVVFVVFASIPELWSSITALVVFVAASVTDHVDGKWARDKHLVTNLGAFLDPLADKMLIDLALLVLTVSGIIPIWVFAIILVRDLAVDGMRMMSALEGITISASFFGKLKTTFQIIAVIVILFNQIVKIEPIAVIGYILLYFALFLTVYSGADYLIKGWKKVIK